MCMCQYNLCYVIKRGRSTCNSYYVLPFKSKCFNVSVESVMGVLSVCTVLVYAYYLARFNL